MLTIAERVPANFEKPYQVVRGLSSRLPWAWDGLCFATAINQANTAGLVDEVTGDIADSLTGVTYAFDEWRNPAVVSTAASNTAIGWPVSPIHHRPSTALTAYVRAKLLGTPEFEGGMICLQSTTGTSPVSFIIEEAFGGGWVTAMVSIDDFMIVVEHTETPPPANEYVNYFLRWQTGGEVLLDCLYDDTTPQTSQAVHPALSGTIDHTASERLYLCRSHDPAGPTQWPGHYSQAMVWSRRLTDTEIRALTIDPFGWCSPRRETVVLSGVYLPGSQPFMQAGGRG